MLSLLHNLLADISTMPWVALVSIIGSFIMGPVVIFIVFRSIQQRQQMWHETARMAIERGQPLPPMPADVQPPADEPPSKFNDLRAGLVLMGVGLGLFLFLGALISRPLGYVGAIPGFIGVALVISSFFNRPAPQPHAKPSSPERPISS